MRALHCCKFATSCSKRCCCAAFSSASCCTLCRKADSRFSMLASRVCMSRGDLGPSWSAGGLGGNSELPKLEPAPPATQAPRLPPELLAPPPQPPPAPPPRPPQLPLRKRPRLPRPPPARGRRPSVPRRPSPRRPSPAGLALPPLPRLLPLCKLPGVGASAAAAQLADQPTGDSIRCAKAGDWLIFSSSPAEILESRAAMGSARGSAAENHAATGDRTGGSKLRASPIALCNSESKLLRSGSSGG